MGTTSRAALCDCHGAMGFYNSTVSLSGARFKYMAIYSSIFLDPPHKRPLHAFPPHLTSQMTRAYTLHISLAMEIGCFHIKGGKCKNFSFKH